jgi:hypothetical protein
LGGGATLAVFSTLSYITKAALAFGAAWKGALVASAAEVREAAPVQRLRCWGWQASNPSRSPALACLAPPLPCQPPQPPAQPRITPQDGLVGPALPCQPPKFPAQLPVTRTLQGGLVGGVGGNSLRTLKAREQHDRRHLGQLSVQHAREVDTFRQLLQLERDRAEYETSCLQVRVRGRCTPG